MRERARTSALLKLGWNQAFYEATDRQSLNDYREQHGHVSDAQCRRLILVCR